jgi:hypothetical protein
MAKSARRRGITLRTGPGMMIPASLCEVQLKRSVDLRVTKT